MKPFEFHEPTSIEEACDLLARHGNQAAVLAGGTALLIDMRHGELQPRHVVSLWKISGLDVFRANGGLEIGTLQTVRKLGDSVDQPVLAGLREAAGLLGSWQVQNMATVGGNICKASPGADLVPPLLCLDARLDLQSAHKRRDIPLDGFLIGPDQTAIDAGEVLVKITVPPPPPRSGTAFLKIMRRQALDCSIVSVCSRVTLEPDGVTCKEARIGLAAVAPNPFRAKRAEAALAGARLDDENIHRAAELAQGEARPITDVRASAEYRRLLVAALVNRTLHLAADRARKGMAAR
jgi:carbon-monoxide dehydrogenase medium subunit